MVWLWKALISFVFLSMLVLTTALGSQTKSTQAKLLPIKVGGVLAKVELADTPRKRNKGLMNRQSMAKGQGMLFVFKQEQKLNFWMKNTFIALSIGFFDSKKKLTEVIDMEPVLSLMQKQIPTYESKSPAQFALEMNRGWFKKNHIKKGSSLKLLPLK